MLFPRDSPTRHRLSLNGLWRFVLDPDDKGRGDGWWKGLPDSAIDMPVPASYNDIIPDPAMRDHVGEAWYATHVRCRRRGQDSECSCGSARRPTAPRCGSRTLR
jgi:beta-glucuronidase